MRKLGGYAAAIAGVLGVLGGILTVLVGVQVGSPETDSAAEAVYWLGWGGILLSAVVVALGLVAARTHSRVPPILLIVAGAAGVLLSGGLTSMFMGVAIVGGIVALFGEDRGAADRTGGDRERIDPRTRP